MPGSFVSAVRREPARDSGVSDRAQRVGDVPRGRPAYLFSLEGQRDRAAWATISHGDLDCLKDVGKKEQGACLGGAEVDKAIWSTLALAYMSLRTMTSRGYLATT
jgi:hypothetical protein